MTVLIYGANGYLGSLLSAAASGQGVDAILAARSKALGALAHDVGLDYRVGEIEDIDLHGIDVVINAAGPFARTAAPLARRCIEAGVHYVDLAGEVAEFALVHQMSEPARAGGVTLMPGVGFGVVPTDCLALHLKNLVPDGVSIDIAFATSGGVSGGTLRTMASAFGDRGAVAAEELRVRTVNFDSGTKRCIQNPWRGDLMTIPLSTGIVDVTTWISLPRPFEAAMASAHRSGDVDAPPLLARLIRKLAARAPAGPSPGRLARGRADVWAQIVDSAGMKTTATLVTPDAYLHSVDAALEIARRLAAGSGSPGFRTPAQEFGADFVTTLPGVVRRDR